MAKRILVYTNHFYPEHFKVNEVVDWLTDSGHQVHVITGLPNYPRGKIFEGYGFFKRSDEKLRNGLRIKRLPLVTRGKGGAFRLMLNYGSYFFSCLLYTLYIALFHEKYDLILVHHTSPMFITIPPIIYKKIKKSKTILWDLDMWPDTLEALGVLRSKRLINWIEILSSSIYKQYDHILIGSNGFYQKALQRTQKQNISYFPNWAELTLENNKLESLEGFSPPEDMLKIMYTGNIGVAQNFDLLIKAIKSIKKEKVYWIFIGDGRFKNTFIKEITQKKLLNNIEFIDYQKIELIPSYVFKSDLLFLSLRDTPIFSNTVPAKLQAYMALGKPVLGMINGEGAKLINKSNSGFTVPAGDSKGLEKKIKLIMKMSKKELDIKGNNGKVFYTKYFSSKARKKQILELINQV